MIDMKMIGSCLVLLLAAALIGGCTPEAEARGGDDDGSSDSDSDSDTDADSDSDSDGDCGLNELETFESDIPSGWTIVDGGTSAGTWTWADALPDEFQVAAIVDGGALIDSAAAGVGATQDDDLESPLYDLADCTSASLSYDHNFQKDLVGSDMAEVYLLPGGDGTPILLEAYETDSSKTSLDAETIEITQSMLGEATTFKIVFHYEGSHDLGWYVDNVAVDGSP